MPLNPLQKGAVALLSAVGALMRPQRGDLVAAVGETVGSGLVLPALRDRMRAHPVGRQILEERPRITDDTLDACRAMPPGTFGAAYSQFMGDRRFHANDRPPVRFVDDEELAYVVTRAREVHDLWHVLFDCHTNVFGELALKGLEFVQTGLPMTGLAVLGAQYRLGPGDRELLQRHYLPWALRAGSRCADLLCIYYERHFQDELEQVRKEFRIIPAPPPPQHLRFKGAKQPPQQPQQQLLVAGSSSGMPGPVAAAALTTPQKS
ncbi:hypothetical protein CHLRE_03g154850v5 [Chlamydomonas reinhardtii]|uniref:Ubiquinone biosynthesis protein COQ4 homolog, mitochondrial n=1 Tax=Chlamydomonas reinhardtii TaxID=3055 RepID=A0A2K3DVY4_CHLRE|nr:uncharacterized protein CHLRE_03g154850v5 [Chlamydomonas reinhardtii]PNW84693.1 hypothetical protein CHLRE_03g154850v5 [Chlamydomonas reinhardtii]